MNVSFCYMKQKDIKSACVSRDKNIATKNLIRYILNQCYDQVQGSFKFHLKIVRHR